jgi:glycosyltransferase involved in cell wall biosynthesis
MKSFSLSVVMSCYKRDTLSHFSEALKSIFSQTYSPDEIIVVADGPISEELNEYLSISEMQKGLVVIRLERNSGLGFARNLAISRAKGELIAVMDADDISRPYRFEEQIQVFSSQDVDIVGGYIQEFSGEGCAVREVPISHREIYQRGKSRSPFNHVSVMFKKSLYEAVGGYRPIRGVEDYDLWHRMLIAGARGLNIPKVLVDVRFGSDDVDRRRGLEYFRCWKDLILDMHASGYIGLLRMLILISIHFVLRMSPPTMIRYYYYLLRR